MHICDTVPKLHLYPLHALIEHLIKQGSRHRSEAVSGHLRAVIAHGPQCGSHSTITELPTATTRTGENIPTATSERRNLLQHLHRLFGERHDDPLTGFGFLFGDVPPITLDLIPLHRAHVARALEGQRRHQKRTAHHQRALVVINRQHQPTNLIRFHQGAVMRRLCGPQSITDVCRGIAFTAAFSDPVAEHLPCNRLGSTGRLNGACSLHTTQHTQQLGWSDLANRPMPEVRQQMQIQHRGVSFNRSLGQTRQLHLHPFMR